MIKRHLTIVDDTTASPAATAPPRRLSADRNGQFRLELNGGDIRRILIIVMDQVHGVRLAAVVENFHPITVVDLRQTIRFDVPGSSRTAFFDQLNRVHSTYLRVPVEWHSLQIRHINHRSTLPTRLYHEAVERWEGPIALLVSKIEHARYMESMLNMALTERRSDGWGIEHVV